MEKRREQQMSKMDRALTLLIADRVKRGHSLGQIAHALRVSNKKLIALARKAKIRYKHRRATTKQIEAAVRAVVDEGLTFRASAERHGMSKTAVHRFVQRRRNKAVDAAGDLVIEKRKWRCPEHGWVSVFPCVACAARSARD
jgi:predicted DNA-binding protein (UPF0251 family)